MITIDDKNYELKYNIQRIGLIEAATGTSVMATMQKNGGMLSINEYELYFAYALKEEGSELFVTPKKGMELAEKHLLEKGYAEAVAYVLEAIQRDCPFFFQAAL